MSLSKPTLQPQERLQDTAANFKRYYYLIFGRLWLILLIIAVGVGGTWAWLQRQPFIYASTATVLVEQAEPRVIKMEKVENEKPESAEFVLTAVQMLGSKELMHRAAKSLSLNKDFDLGSRKPDGSKFTLDEVASIIGERVKAKLRRLTRLIDVTAEDTDPKRAQIIAEAVATEFLKQSYEQNASLSRAANEFLFQEADRLKLRLEQSEQKLQKYREKSQAVSLEDRQNIIVDKLKEINSQAAQAKEDRLRLESDLEQIKSIDPSNTEELMRIESVAKLPQVAEIRVQIVSEESEFAVLKKRYLHLHPKYVQAVSQIGNLKQFLADAVAKAGGSIEKRYQAAAETEQKLDAALKEQEKIALDLNQISIPYNVLAREVASDRSMYDAVMTRLRETTVTQSLDKTPFRIVEQPQVANTPVKPNRTKVLLTAFFLSLAAGIGIVLALDSIDATFRSVDEIEQSLGVPLIAAVPEAAALKSRNLLVSHPKTGQAESFRTLATSLSLIGPEENRRTFLVTSAVPSEGKTFNAIHCATAFAQNGLKTILVDADLRRPQLHGELLNGKSEYLGLSDYLSELATLEQTIAPTDIDQLDLIPAGRHCPKPMMVLSDPAFPALIERLLSDYDRVIVDSAPVNAVSDTLLLAKYFNGVCLVVRNGKTPRSAVERAVRLLEQSGANIVGTILNRLPRGYGAGYYFYYYGDEYAKGAAYGTAGA
jgi:succinoglycan biosynthesis transport protein ExoP